MVTVINLAGRSKTEGYGFKVRGQKIEKDLLGSFSDKGQWVLWNDLAEEVTEAGMITAIERHLNRFMLGNGCGSKRGKWDSLSYKNRLVWTCCAEGPFSMFYSPVTMTKEDSQYISCQEAL